MNRNTLKMFGIIVKSNKGGKNLVFAGNRYYKNNDNADKQLTYWRCVKRRICNGSVTTTYFPKESLVEKLEVLKIGVKHTHETEEMKLQAEEIVRGIKRRAEAHPNEPPLKILQDEIGKVERDEVIMQIPERRSLFRTVNRRQSSQRPKIPKTLEELQILPPYDKTKSNQQFLQLDTGCDDDDRIILFYTNANLENLCSTKIVFSDGTFKTVPKPFLQLYTFHSEFHGHVFPVAYALTMRKTQATYVKILNHLSDHAKQLGQRFAPENAMMDYELAVVNAFKTVTPDTFVKGCLFHWSQSIWRQATVTYGLKVYKGI